jgi:hypothetical protein
MRARIPFMTSAQVFGPLMLSSPETARHQGERKPRGAADFIDYAQYFRGNSVARDARPVQV